MSADLDFILRAKDNLVNTMNESASSLYFVTLSPASLWRNTLQHPHGSPMSRGVWEWKGPVIQETGCAYGKFFERKAAFISAEWFPDFANYRRDGYDFDARFDDGLASYKDK